MHTGISKYSVQRVISTQKLPSVLSPPAVKARTTATAAAMPVAAERKLCTVRPIICAPYEIWDSGV